MRKHKIIFTGPRGAGKTSAVAAISDVRPVATERVASDLLVKQSKDAPVMVMDFGAMKLPGGDKLYLYGTPENFRVGFSREALAGGVLGVILLINNCAPDPLQDMHDFLESLTDLINETSVVIGITGMEEASHPALEDYQQVLRKRAHVTPVFEIDARERKDVLMLLEVMLYMLDPGLANG